METSKAIWVQDLDSNSSIAAGNFLFIYLSTYIEVLYHSLGLRTWRPPPAVFPACAHFSFFFFFSNQKTSPKPLWGMWLQLRLGSLTERTAPTGRLSHGVTQSLYGILHIYYKSSFRFKHFNYGIIEWQVFSSLGLFNFRGETYWNSIISFETNQDYCLSVLATCKFSTLYHSLSKSK